MSLIERCFELGVISAVDRAFAQMWENLSDDGSLLLAYLYAQSRAGNACLFRLQELDIDDREIAAEVFAAMERGWVEVMREKGGLPVQCDEKRLYLQRFCEGEENLANELTKLIGKEVSPVSGGEGDIESKILGQSLTCIYGLPASGKTTLAAKLCQKMSKVFVGRVVVVAATGQGLSQLRKIVEGGDRGELWHLLPLLKRKYSLVGADIVIVDDCSVIDLHRWVELLAAIPASARVVLLGNRENYFAEIVKACGGIELKGEMSTFARCAAAGNVLGIEGREGVHLCEGKLKTRRASEVYEQLWERYGSGNCCLVSFQEKGPYSVAAINDYFVDRAFKGGVRELPVVMYQNDWQLEFYSGERGVLRLAGVGRNLCPLKIEDEVIFEDGRRAIALELQGWGWGYCSSICRSVRCKKAALIIAEEEGVNREMMNEALSRGEEVDLWIERSAWMAILDKSSRFFSGLGEKLSNEFFCRGENYRLFCESHIS